MREGREREEEKNRRRTEGKEEEKKLLGMKLLIKDKWSDTRIHSRVVPWCSERIGSRNFHGF
jgi:hypothetical protein